MDEFIERRGSGDSLGEIDLQKSQINKKFTLQQKKLQQQEGGGVEEDSQQREGWRKYDTLHPEVLKSLLDNKFYSPTEVQGYVMGSIKHFNDFIIASQTGSGKTLAFGVPIISSILSELDRRKQNGSQPKQQLKALIMAPTRELVLQIEQHLKSLCKNSERKVILASLVGGIAKEKQKRLLRYKPHIVIGTPGRLWDFIGEENHPYLQDLNQLEFLVMDEADRMVELGHFKEIDEILKRVFDRGITKDQDKKIAKEILEQAQKNIQNKKTINQRLMEGEILEFQPKEFEKQTYKQTSHQESQNPLYSRKKKLDFLQKATNLEENDEDEEEENEEDQIEEDEEIEDEEIENEDIENEEDEEDENLDDLEDDEVLIDQDIDGDLDEEIENEEEDDDEVDDEIENEVDGKVEGEDVLRGQFGMDLGGVKKKNVRMKVFLVSATITKQFIGTKHRITKTELKRNKKSEKMQGYIPKLQALFKRIKFSGKPKVIDLTSKTLFPENLVEYKTTCMEEDKPIYLYQLLKRREAENFIIFCNSISYAKKVMHILEVLGEFPVLLHSEMQQRQRLRKLDKFKEGSVRILVCTDVASRGLDIPFVKNVVHYQIPNDIDTYVHRSGRTARIGREGTAFVFVGPKDHQKYIKLCGQLKKDQGIDNLEMDYKEKIKIQALVEQAVKLETKKHQLEKKQREAVWFKKHANAADMEIGDDIEREIKKIEDQVQKRKVVVQQETNGFKQVKRNMYDVNRSRRNAVYLDPNNIRELAEKMKSMKEANQNKNKQTTNPNNNKNFNQKRKNHQR